MFTFRVGTIFLEMPLLLACKIAFLPGLRWEGFAAGQYKAVFLCQRAQV